MKYSIEIPTYYMLTQEEFNDTKNLSLITINCQSCLNNFTALKKDILNNYKRYNKYTSFCSRKCSGKNKFRNSNTLINCKQCNKEFYKLNKEIKKTNNHFCSSSCSSSYNNIGICRVEKNLNKGQSKCLCGNYK